MLLVWFACLCVYMCVHISAEGKGKGEKAPCMCLIICGLFALTTHCSLNFCFDFWKEDQANDASLTLH